MCDNKECRTRVGSCGTITISRGERILSNFKIYTGNPTRSYIHKHNPETYFSIIFVDPMAGNKNSMEHLRNRILSIPKTYEENLTSGGTENQPLLQNTITLKPILTNSDMGNPTARLKSLYFIKVAESINEVKIVGHLRCVQEKKNRIRYCAISN